MRQFWPPGWSLVATVQSRRVFTAVCASSYFTELVTTADVEPNKPPCFARGEKPPTIGFRSREPVAAVGNQPGGIARDALNLAITPGWFPTAATLSEDFPTSQRRCWPPWWVANKNSTASAAQEKRRLQAAFRVGAKYFSLQFCVSTDT